MGSFLDNFLHSYFMEEKMNSSALLIEDLTFWYPDGHAALKGVSLEVAPKEKHGIIGPNGSGKSTLLQLITGLLEKKSGQIRAGDTLLEKSTLKDIRRKTGMLFQNSDEQLFSPSVRADVAFGPRNMGLSREEVEARTEMAMKNTGISHLADRPPYTLSGGEKKSAALASILSMDPEILLMDEPGAGLDSLSRRGLIRIINQLPHSMLLVSHDLDLIWDTCSRVSILFNGCMVETGDTRSILKNQNLLEKYHMELPLTLQRCALCNKGDYYAVEPTVQRAAANH